MDNFIPIVSCTSAALLLVVAKALVALLQLRELVRNAERANDCRSIVPAICKSRYRTTKDDVVCCYLDNWMLPHDVEVINRGPKTH